MLSAAIVVPCYNEASRLPVAHFREYLQQHPNLSFVLVNDGSSDDTSATLKQVQQGLENQVHVIDRAENRGKGESVREGMLYALDNLSPEVVGFWDADLATPLEAIGDLRPLLEQHPEVQMVFGSRVNLLGRHIKRQTVRHYLGRIFATSVSVMLRLPIYDTQCGAKLFRATPDLKHILSEGPFITRWVFDVELIARWIRFNRFAMDRVRQSIYEFPLYRWEDVGGSKVKPHDFLKAFVDVVRIYWTYLK